MAGLGLNVGGYGSVASSQAASLPAQAGNPAGPSTIGVKAFGITTSQTDVGPRTAGFGTVALGLAGVGILIFLWKSLPR
jgi:hypothetical protein